jgi:hypothetical protein
MSVLVILVATAAPATLGAASRPAISGAWTATAGATAFHGKWSAQALPESPNAVIGSWALLNDGGEVTMQGIWSAKRSGRDWRGTWQANRIALRTARAARRWGGSA